MNMLINVKRKSFAALIAASVLLTGCTQIEYPGDGIPFASTSAGYGDTTGSMGEAIPNKYKQKKYDLSAKDFYWGYRPNENFSLETRESLSVTVDLTSSQHYRVWMSASGDGVVALSYGGDELGAYYLSGAEGFSEYYLDKLYFPSGKVELAFTVLKGSALIEEVSVADSSSVSGERYKTSVKLNTPEPSYAAQSTFDYLKSVFGNRTLTGQYCTVNTNAEIEAVQAATGRYPAIRCGDLTNYSRGYNGADKDDNREIELAEEWSLNNGIVFFTWTWQVFGDGFSLSDAVNGQSIYQMDAEQIGELAESGVISKSCETLIKDIDDMAATLSRLAEKDIPVLWNPLPDGGGGLYWWSESGGDYVWLWKLMFERMSYYHGLDNLIWVWSGGGYIYYPGDNYVDIIGEGVYKSGGGYGSEAVKFGYTSDYADGHSEKKPAAVCESGGLPSADVFSRDNVWWLFWSLYKGDYVIDVHGVVLDKIESGLERFYNHENTICLDELPDVVKFGATN